MKFKKMEIYGFKSFADKVQVQFESGVTGIVGPNGCGKSNVADSIRWVLGEQSAKALRGSSMQDVIFNGTEKRKPQSFAEVALYFDNTEKIFNVDYDEVVLSRKLYRSGESGYAINKTPCRLKDVQELLRDSGMGRESYSIIGQGRIDELLSAKPEDRRAVFEEAAGISKLKNRKQESLKKLNNTQENLIRINDILHELEIQLGPLASQAETAKKYLDLRERLKFLEVNNYIYQYDSSSSQKEAINNRLNGINEEIELKTKEFDETVDEYNVTARQIDATDDTISALRDELLNLTVGLEKQAGETKLLQEKISTLKARRDELSTIIEEDGKEFAHLNDSLQKANQDKEL
ncbi:MAG: AAA family ATPase, partial [Clostridia bacterium]|nr:AAA family ATPase [Clostridia bacterium]